ncbi:flavin reductase (DIM6/NTAB) family NADH-FMN oxidoreductase RutF [Arthrobacter globiformis]|uniref:flavin reductase family protein n=1 Tax=Arthrobacter globiformis TaxID=1665 RepID=UPI002785F147|nr:flavin reductase family protein [Arthrobacter globiformis]MDQ1058095.1 flavin reductase (DIM6/NTAB) family NADH-FMN oxidoreductase RutF [Arthrobacter globiformis]
MTDTGTTAITENERAADLSNRVRAVHRQYPTGVTVVTAGVDGKPYGLAVNAFSSISLDPPLVLVCVNESSNSYGPVFASDYIGINILAADQVGVAGTFAKSGGDKFAELDWELSRLGVPVLAGVAGHFELEVKYKIPAYSHTIFVGQVVEAASADKAPLVYQAGKFFDGARLEPVQ